MRSRRDNGAIARGAAALGALVAVALATGCGEGSSGDAGGTSAGAGAGGAPSSASSAAQGATGASTGSTTDPPPLRFAFQPIALSGEHVDVTEIRFFPEGSDEFLLLEKSGRVSHYRLEGDSAKRLGWFEMPGVDAQADGGMIAAAFDPDFETNRLFYLAYCRGLTSSGIVRLTFDANDLAGIPASAADVLFLDEPSAQHAWHNVGAIGFDDTGALWALFGEKTIPMHAQDPANDFGKLLRILPNREPGGSGYEPAPDNPFAGDPTKSPDVYALGLRSPWRGALDAEGRYWIGDVGADAFEEINVLLAPGANFGWPLSEGECTDACMGLVDPVTAWGRSSSEAYALDDPDTSASFRRSAWVAGPYAPPAGLDRYDGRLDGVMLFGDFFTGWVRGMRIDASGAVVSDVRLGNLPAASSWDTGPDGWLYVVTYGSYQGKEDVDANGRLFRVLPANER